MIMYDLGIQIRDLSIFSSISSQGSLTNFTQISHIKTHNTQVKLLLALLALVFDCLFVFCWWLFVMALIDFILFIIKWV